MLRLAGTLASCFLRARIVAYAVPNVTKKAKNEWYDGNGEGAQFNSSTIVDAAEEEGSLLALLLSEELAYCSSP